MADWMDWLEGISGGASGVVKGLTAGAEPFNAWEKVRTQDLANDKSDIQLRDLLATQNAYEASPDFYGNKATAANTGFQLNTAKGLSDIYGLNENLDLQKNLADPNGFFQMKVNQLGLEPGSPEYRALLAQMIGQSNPQAGVKAFDTYGIPGLEQRNLNEQAALGLVEAWAKQLDPGARVVRMPDGTVVVLDSQGQPTEVPPNLMVQAAAMLADKTSPYGAISQGIADETKIQQGNVKLLEAFQKAGLTGSQAVQVLYNRRQNIDRAVNDARLALNALAKDPEYMGADEATKAEKRAPYEQQIAAAQAERQKVNSILDSLFTQSPQGARAVGRMVSPGVPQATGNSALVAPRAPVSALVQRAVGGPGIPQRLPPTVNRGLADQLTQEYYGTP